MDLQTKNALGWALQGQINDVNTDPLVFGVRVQDLIAHPSTTPALGEVHFHAAFTNPRPGAPLPDLVCINAAFCPAVVPCPNLQMDFLSIEAGITGPLHAPDWPEGAPGRMTVTQVGINNPAVHKTPAPGPVSDGFPVESIALSPIGK